MYIYKMVKDKVQIKYLKILLLMIRQVKDNNHLTFFYY